MLKYGLAKEYDDHSIQWLDVDFSFNMIKVKKRRREEEKKRERKREMKGTV